MKTIEENYTLSNGIEIPKLGLGKWFIRDENAAQAVKEAVKTVIDKQIQRRHI